LHSFKKCEMNSKRAFEIAFVGLKQGEHHFEYELEESFFIEKGALIESGIKAIVKLQLDKHVGFMMLKFVTDGKAHLNCDRCGNELEASLWDEFNLVVKLVENPAEMNESEEDPDIFYIARSESHIELSDWLYEFVILSIPAQNICKQDENNNSLCNKEVLDKLEAMNKEVGVENTIWKGLEKFKKN
jgi:uncharacterized metal-binding protein YceD (DUF177 family)